MGYIVKELKHNNKTLIALFDSGSVFTYVKESSLPKDTFFVPITPIKVRLAGEKHTITKMCSIEVSIDKYKFSFLAYPLKLIGKIVFNNKEIDIDLLISVIVMEQWDIGIDPKNQKLLFFNGIKKRDFISF